MDVSLRDQAAPDALEEAGPELSSQSLFPSPQSSLACLLTTVPRYAAASLLKENALIWGKDSLPRESLPTVESRNPSHPACNVQRGVAAGWKLQRETGTSLWAADCDGATSAACSSDWGDARCTYTGDKARATSEVRRQEDTHSSFCGLPDERDSSRDVEEDEKTHPKSDKDRGRAATRSAIHSGQASGSCKKSGEGDFVPKIAAERQQGWEARGVEALCEGEAPRQIHFFSSAGNPELLRVPADSRRLPHTDGGCDRSGSFSRTALGPEKCSFAPASAHEGETDTMRRYLKARLHAERSQEDPGAVSILERGTQEEEAVNERMGCVRNERATETHGAVSECLETGDPAATVNGESAKAAGCGETEDASPQEEECDSEAEEQERERRVAANYKPLFVPVDERLGKKINCSFVRGDLRMYPKKLTQFGEVHYSPRYEDDRYVYRHVLLSSGVRKAAEEMAKHHSKTGFLSEEQFIYQLGIDLSPGWQHFMRFKGRLRELILRRPPTVEDEKRDGAPGEGDEISVDSDDSDFDESSRLVKTSRSSRRSADVADTAAPPTRLDDEEQKSGIALSEASAREASCLGPVLSVERCDSAEEQQRRVPERPTEDTQEKPFRQRAGKAVLEAAAGPGGVSRLQEEADKVAVVSQLGVANSASEGSGSDGAQVSSVHSRRQPSAEIRSQAVRKDGPCPSVESAQEAPTRERESACGASDPGECCRSESEDEKGKPPEQVSEEVARQRSCVQSRGSAGPRACRKRKGAPQVCGVEKVPAKAGSGVCKAQRCETACSRRSCVAGKQVFAEKEGERNSGQSSCARGRRRVYEQKKSGISGHEKHPKRPRRARVAGEGTSPS
ncbi:cyclin-dependent kinase regulatory subunit protein [Toxoplasma gondii RUB]|uniref:Cyclin-dependent kinases regulatory subunit n=1 Tax=Toxoplasma gondii RUB TaxID=935652 RepID=A0A086M2A7_TOXGO|nr:cyclin-dependent kinase regulatory subunit protein [Toxoplasma gondii RUB]